ncbi:hypothetical protein T09_12532, partial [Trichinella sp. T9]
LRKYRATLSIQCVDPFCCAARRTTLSSSPCVWILSAEPHEEPPSALHPGKTKWNGDSV